ncbi:nitrate reductase [NADH] [Cladorrhinum sp. PSN332]|nr:nitrate reductase [NADH] [Cladorrhinum sp. PSN332]
MPHNIPWEVKVKSHPGSSKQEIEDEPDWSKRSSHGIGYKNRDGDRTGISGTNHDDHDRLEAIRKRQELRDTIEKGDLVNFRDIIEHQTSLYLQHPENRSLGWRYVLETTEDWVKNKEKWPINEKKKEAKLDREGKENFQIKTVDGGKGQQEVSWRSSKERKPAPAAAPQERALLAALRHEVKHIFSLQQNDGTRPCPQRHNRTSISIDEQDQFTPDNWLPRSPALIRLTGRHPMNAEPPLSALHSGGLVTPNELHFIRNHGPELNLLRRSKGANNGAASVACAYWKGPPVRDILLSAGLSPDLPKDKRLFINFAGADSPSEGTYETSLLLEYVMDQANDVILAVYMNDLPLPPDHGYPVRLIIPGYIGGRCVKWLKKTWLSGGGDKSYYHVWGNRVVPGWVRGKGGDVAEAVFRNPSSACYEMGVNSVVCKPAQGEVVDWGKRGMYKIEGFAYDGGGREVQRVEVSIDGGKTWLYAVREFPEYPVRHGSKFWTWVHWSVEVDVEEMAKGPGVMVRAWDQSKTVQPDGLRWNLTGMMNNSWYMVKPEVFSETAVLFRHPTEAGTLDGGYMKPSEEVKKSEANQVAEGAPEKEFTREEIEKHDKEDDCWLVVDNKVYDATSVLKWHPGGKPPILAHAGRCHQETTDHFVAIHDDFAWKKLNECILGRVTQKTADLIKQNAKASSTDQAANISQEKFEKTSPLALQEHRWIPVKLISRREISPDTRTYTFALPEGKSQLGLGTCQHLQLGIHMQDKMLVRPYTPTRPIMTFPLTPPPSPVPFDIVKPPFPTLKGTKHKKKYRGKNHHHHLAKPPAPPSPATFGLTIKTYFPSEDQPGGALSNLLDCTPLGEQLEIRGPTGDIIYNGFGNFTILSPFSDSSCPDRQLHFDRVSLVLGGSGITPGYALIARIMNAPGDTTQVRVVDANRTEGDILLREELDEFVNKGKGQVEIMHVLSRPGEGWTGEKGRVDEDRLKRGLFPPVKGQSVAFLCGPEGLVKDWGYILSLPRLASGVAVCGVGVSGVPCVSAVSDPQGSDKASSVAKRSVDSEHLQGQPEMDWGRRCGLGARRT